jgi:UDP-4-amino-4,6-dideoxy-N-acetyl-beta-L-altrosamine N-acetyltransferase
MRDYGTLRAIRDNEIELIRGWRNAPNVRVNMYTRHEIGADEHRAWWSAVQTRSDQAYFMYEFCGTPTGVVAFNAIDRVNCNSSWAFYANPHSPKGVGTRMEFLALEHAFNDLSLHKLYCEVFAFNKPVIRLHQKFGFQTEGTLRDQRIVDGVFIDVLRLGILASEWTLMRAIMQERIDARWKD